MDAKTNLRKWAVITVLLAALNGVAQAQTDINVVNPSFEWAADGNLVTCRGEMGDVLGWTQGGIGWAGVDVNCGWGLAGEHCCDWLVFPDGNAICWVDTGASVYQVTDEDIVGGHAYTLTGTYTSDDGQGRVQLFCPWDSCTPDVNHIALTGKTIDLPLVYDPCSGLMDWQYDVKLKFVAEPAQAYLGKKLGIKFENTGVYSGNYIFVDDIRLQRKLATEAYGPSPADGAELVSKVPILGWSPGFLAEDVSGHEVYFGTSWAEVNDANSSDTTGVYRGIQSPNSYTPTENPLMLGETCYWRIDEVNESYIPGPVPAPPNGRWKGNVWSFGVEGPAHDPVPFDGERDVIFLGLELAWSAGAEAENHVVYFGTDAQAVADATTSSPEYKTTLTVGTESWSPGQLIVNRRYYWRIDEKSDGGAHTVKGDIWSFAVGAFLVVDDFESYGSDANLLAVWDDYWVNGYDGEIFLETDPNIIREPGSRAAKLEFTNISKKLPGSWFDVQDLSELEVGSDWTVGGVKALFLYIRGDPCNVQATDADGKAPWVPLWEAATPWVELEDTSSNTGYVVHPNPEQMGWGIWEEWNIDLNVFDACGVELSAIDRFTIGIGGTEKTGQIKAMTGTGNIWVDDIRLYPPRCRPELSELVGDFTSDCNVDYFDVKVMATDWLMQDGNILTENRPATLTGFPDATSHWVSGYMGGAIEVNEGYNIDVNDPRLYGIASMSITAWIKQPIENVWAGIVTSREFPDCEGSEVTEFAVYGGEYCCPIPGLGYDWACLPGCWQHDFGLDVPDGTWTFCALVVDPTGASAYMRPDGSALQTGLRNWGAHPIQQNFAHSFMIGRSREDDGYFVGAIDDVRIYTYALDFNDVNGLAYQTTDPNPAPVYHYKFDETTGYTAADSGTPTGVYGPVQSVANLTDPEPKNSRFVNFADYAIFADNWMAQDFWPGP
ncbi:MAG: hypothetical protein JSV99_03070 [Planctomycetota bacterium]|nr:MAG: hypothetical protein JSV99_03070 [Planctomycetota bacterium]